MAERRMIALTPSSDVEAWNAWLAYYRAVDPNKEMTMLVCARDGRAFRVWTRLPPERADARNLSKPEARKPDAIDALKEQRLHGGAHFVGNIEEVADRLERRAEIESEDAREARARRTASAGREGALGLAFTQVLSNQRPDVEGVEDLGVVHVPDPYELEQVYEGRRDPDSVRPRPKISNLRDDPVGQMAKREQISGEQLEAARRWQAWHDTAQIGQVRGLNPFEVAVDGGRFAEPVSDVQRAAIKKLVRADMRLGEVGAMLVRRVLGDRMTVAKVAALLGETSEKEIKRMGWRLRECLDTLVAVTDVVAEGRRPAMRQMPKEDVQAIVDGERMAQRRAAQIKAVPQASARDNREAAAAAAGHGKRAKRRRHG